MSCKTTYVGTKAKTSDEAKAGRRSHLPQSIRLAPLEPMTFFGQRLYLRLSPAATRHSSSSILSRCNRALTDLFIIVSKAASFPIYPPTRRHLASLLPTKPTVIAPQTESIEPNWKSSFDLALGDAALFHMILLCSAIHIKFLSQSTDFEEDFFHKMKAIEVVNQRIQEQTEVNSDNVIRTVAFLAIAEVSSL